MIAANEAAAQLELLVAAITGLLDEADLRAPVPSCPGWTVADLVNHLGQTHLWAEHCIRVKDPELSEVVAPVADREALAVWYAQCAGLLIKTLRATDPA